MRERASLDHELSTLLTGRVGLSPGPGDREVIGLKPRVRVTNTLEPPYRWICYLEATYLDPGERYAEKKMAGTGVLIGPRHVLTAAHNLLSEDGRLKTTHVEVTPGRNGSTKPFGTFDARKWDIHPSWVRNGRSNREFDYALITLKDAIGIRTFTALGYRVLGYWGHPTAGAGTRRDVLDPARLGRRIVNVAGYPDDRPTGTLWRGEGAVRGPSAPNRSGEILPADRLLLHAVDTERGQSGGPVWTRYNQPLRRYLVGIHVAPASVWAIDATGTRRRTHNLAVRVNDDVNKQIAAWM